MTKVVLDASALCALIFRETGHETVAAYLPDSLMSVVNLTEVLTKAIDYKKSFEKSLAFIESLPIRLVPFDLELAGIAAKIREETRPFGLSLGDRACLASGIKLGLPVVTSDADWSLTGLKVEVIAFR